MNRIDPKYEILNLNNVTCCFTVVLHFLLNRLFCFIEQASQVFQAKTESARELIRNAIMIGIATLLCCVLCNADCPPGQQQQSNRKFLVLCLSH